jgi:hypothetical protein
MNRITFRSLLSLALLLVPVGRLYGQITTFELDGSDSPFRTEVSALFLTISPDARSAGMGDAGAASEPDVNAQHWNPAKYAMIKGKGGVTASYTPWLRNLIPGINLGYLSGYYRINDKNVLSSSLRFISLGEIIFTNLSGVTVYTDHPYEFAGDLAYSRKFTEHLSAGLSIRYIYSDPAPSQTNETTSGKSVAGDLGIYYQRPFAIGERSALWALGCNISNIGTPITYQSVSEDKLPIPTNLRMGGRMQIDLNETNSISFLVDANKLLVPTGPVFDDSIYAATGELVVLRGKEAPASTLFGMLQSFYDAPGYRKEDGTYSVFREELHEINYSFGAEYWFDGKFAIRSGYHHEHATKGNRKFFTLGFGGRYKFLAADFSCLIPVNGQNSPLARTWRFTLTAEFGRTAKPAGSDPS